VVVAGMARKLKMGCSMMLFHMLGWARLMCVKLHVIAGGGVHKPSVQNSKHNHLPAIFGMNLGVPGRAAIIQVVNAS